MPMFRNGAKMLTGNITRILYDKEYGLITSVSGEEAHFHQQCLWNTKFSDLREGQEVEFEIQQSRKGFLAFQIRPISRKDNA